MLEQLPILYINGHVIIIIRLKLPHLKWSREKQRQSMKKILVVAGESNPGALALATSALTIELRQPTTSMTFTFYLYTVALPLAAVSYSTDHQLCAIRTHFVTCCSSMVRALVAKTRGPGFDPPATTKIFHIFPLFLSRSL